MTLGLRRNYSVFRLPGPRTVLNNDDCSGLPLADPGMLSAVGRPLADCSAPS